MPQYTPIMSISDAMTPFSYSLMQERSNVPVGSRCHLFYMTSFNNSSIELVYSSVDCFVDGMRLLPGVRLEDVGHYVDIYSSELSESDIPDCTVTMKVISPDGTEAIEEVTFNVIILDDRTPGFFEVPREVVVDVGGLVITSAVFGPEGIWDKRLEVRPNDSSIIKVDTDKNNIFVKGLKPGTASLTVSSLKYPDCRAVINVFVREICTLDIDCKVDGRSLPTEFFMRMSSESEFRFRLIVFIEYSTYRRHHSIMVNENECERVFVSNKRCVIPNLAEKMRMVMRYSGVKKIRIDYSILDYDRKLYKVTTNKKYYLTESKCLVKPKIKVNDK